MCPFKAVWTQHRNPLVTLRMQISNAKNEEQQFNWGRKKKRKQINCRTHLYQQRTDGTNMEFTKHWPCICLPPSRWNDFFNVSCLDRLYKKGIKDISLRDHFNGTPNKDFCGKHGKQINFDQLLLFLLLSPKPIDKLLVWYVITRYKDSICICFLRHIDSYPKQMSRKIKIILMKTLVKKLFQLNIWRNIIEDFKRRIDTF